MSQGRSLKKPLLYLLIVSVVLGAILGIFLVLRNTWGWIEVRVMLTTIIVAAASLCGLASDVAKLPRGPNILPRAGLVLTGIAASLLLLGIWLDFGEELYWKSTTALCFFAVATVHVCLLSIARLVGRFRWVAYIAYQLIFGLALMLTIVVFGEFNSEPMWRLIAALSIIVAAISLVIPILHRIGRMDRNDLSLMSPGEQRNIASIDAEISRLREQIGRLQAIRGQLIGEQSPVEQSPVEQSPVEQSPVK